MLLKINCKFNDSGAWCRCKQVKRSLKGFGARCCMEYSDNPIKCPHKTN